MLNSIELCIDPWGTPLVIGFQLDIILLITTLLTCLLSQFSVPTSLSAYQLLYEDLMGDSAESLTEVQVDKIQCSPQIYQASHFIIDIV